jgi:hypothetical protein
MQIAIIKLSDEEVKQLQEMVNNGWATDFETKLYYHIYNLSLQDAESTVNSFI